MELEYTYCRMPARIYTTDFRSIVMVDGYPWPEAYEYSIEEGWAKGYCRTAICHKPSRPFFFIN